MFLVERGGHTVVDPTKWHMNYSRILVYNISFVFSKKGTIHLFFFASGQAFMAGVFLPNMCLSLARSCFNRTRITTHSCGQKYKSLCSVAVLLVKT
jgi:hypothetical protein